MCFQMLGKWLTYLMEGHQRINKFEIIPVITPGKTELILLKKLKRTKI